MKQTLNNIKTGLLALLIFSIVMIVLGSGCSPRIVVPVDPPTSLPWNNDKPKLQQQDTVTWIPFDIGTGSIKWIDLDSLINAKVVVDTIMIAGEYFEFHDSIPCPDGLEKDSLVYVSFTRTLPDRAVPVSITVMDTLWLTKPCPPCPVADNSGTGWGERAAWIAGLAALLLGYWNQWRNRKTKLA